MILKVVGEPSQTVRKDLHTVATSIVIGAILFLVLVSVSSAFARTIYKQAPPPPPTTPAPAPSNGASQPNGSQPTNAPAPAPSAPGAPGGQAGAAAPSGVQAQNQAAFGTAPTQQGGAQPQANSNTTQSAPSTTSFQPSQLRSLNPSNKSEDTPATLNKAEFNSPEGYSFNPLRVKRDPFTPPAPVKIGLQNALESYDLSQMKLVAILQGFGAPQAMIVLPDGQTHIVKEGDTIGKRAGKVSKITPNEVQVKESFKDFQNRVKTDLTAMVLE